MQARPFSDTSSNNSGSTVYAAIVVKTLIPYGADVSGVADGVSIVAVGTEVDVGGTGVSVGGVPTLMETGRLAPNNFPSVSDRRHVPV